MNVLEREHILMKAAERYLRGEITLEEHTAIRRSFLPDAAIPVECRASPACCEQASEDVAVC